MSAAIGYLLLMRAKNALKQLVRNPGKIAYILFLLVFVGFSVFSNNGSTHEVLRDPAELAAMAFALYFAMFLLLSYNGFSRGGAMFGMPDVNLIFTAPFPTHRVLFYGLLMQLRTALLLGLFIIYQSFWIQSSYGVGFGIIILLLLGYSLTVFCAQLTAMLLYSLTADSDKRRTVFQIVFWAIVAVFAALLCFEVINNGGFNTDNLLARLVSGASGAFSYFPCVGFIYKIILGCVTGQATPIIVGAVLTIGYLAVIVGAVILSKREFYEDVLATAEMTQSAITAQKQGVTKDAVPRNVKMGKIGFTDGEGARMFFKKHLVENRRGGVFGVNLISLIFAAAVIIFSLFMKDIGILAPFGLSVYMMIFSISLGRFTKELGKPYIYLVPEPPIKKLIWALTESLPSFAMQSVIIFVPVGLIVKAPVTELLGAIVGHFGFSCLFLSVGILVQRVFGSSVSRTLMYTFTIFATLLLCGPSVVAAIFAGVALDNIGIALAVTAAVNLPVSVLVLLICRNVLQYAELNNR